MRQLFTCLAVLGFFTMAFAQKTPLTGVFEYRATIHYSDTDLVMRTWSVKAYTNDTLVRVETETGQFGTQVYIRHMELNKAYLLLAYDDKKYAIQTDLNKRPQNDTLAPGYTIKKKFGSKTIAGIKCRKYFVRDKDQPEGYYCWFAKKVPNKYLEVYPDVPGLAVDYYLPSQDGLIHYELVKFTPQPVHRDLFGIPSDYKRVTFDEFVNTVSGGEE
jgi:hypothetical protein